MSSALEGFVFKLDIHILLVAMNANSRRSLSLSVKCIRPYEGFEDSQGSPRHRN